MQDFLHRTRESSSLLKKIEHGVSRWTPTFVSRMLPKGKGDDYFIIAEEAVKEASKAARTINDNQFLSDIVKTDVVQGSLFKPFAEEARETAMSYLKSTVSDLVEKLASSARTHQLGQCIANATTNISSFEVREQRARRSQFIHKINHASIQDSCV